MKWLAKLLNFYNLNKIYKNAEFNRAMQELRILHFDFRNAIKYLKTNYRKYYKLPLYLVIGPSKFGKTTLLANSGLNLTNMYRHNLSTITPTKYCSWWFSNNAIYLDTAGIYSSNEKNVVHYKLVWMAFLKLLKKHFFANPISGIFLVIDIPTLTGPKENLNKILNDLRERIYEISQYANQLPIFIVLTKADLIAGFQKATQPLGIIFPNNQNFINPIFSFNNEFDALSKQLKTQKNYDLQLNLENLRNTITEIIGAIPTGGHISLAALYFTSNTNTQSSEDLFKHVYQYAINAPIEKEISWTQFIFVASSSLLVVIFSLILYRTYAVTTNAIEFTNSALSNYQKNGDRSSLLTAITELDNASETLGSNFGLNQSKQISIELKELIYNTIAPAFIQQLQKTLENEINFAKTTERLRLYDGLKAYLMLGNPDKLNKDFIQNWFKDYLYRTIPNDKLKQQQLETELSIVLEHALPNINLQQQLIASTRDKLNSNPSLLSDDIITTIEKNYASQNLKFKFEKNIISISKIYTIENFDKIYQHEIADIAHSLVQKKSDWVLDNNIKNNITDIDLEKTIDSAKSIYLRNYSDSWEKAFNAIKIDNFADVKQAAEFASDIHKNNFGLIKFLKALKENTSLPQFAATFKDYNSIDLNNLQDQLSNLYNYLDAIKDGNKTDQNAYKNAVLHFQNEHQSKNDAIEDLRTFATKQPKQIQPLLLTIADNSWQAILNSAQNYLNQIWIKTVFPEYQQYFNNNYPLFKDAKNSVSIADFSHFFGPNGTVDQYFTTYLKPFVDTNQVYWEWKQLNGKRLNISQDTLEMFIRAALIQKMFFPDNSKTINTEFTLIPKDISPNSQNFILNFEGQTLNYKTNSKKPIHLVWQAQPKGNISYEFIDIHGKHVSNNLDNSPWAWLKLLDKSNLRSLNNSQHYELVFDLNGNAVKYHLTTEQPINPFIPNIVNNFRCPANL